MLADVEKGVDSESEYYISEEAGKLLIGIREELLRRGVFVLSGGQLKTIYARVFPDLTEAYLDEVFDGIGDGPLMFVITSVSDAVPDEAINIVDEITSVSALESTALSDKTLNEAVICLTAANWKWKGRVLNPHWYTTFGHACTVSIYEALIGGGIAAIERVITSPANWSKIAWGCFAINALLIANAMHDRDSANGGRGCGLEIYPGAWLGVPYWKVKDPFESVSDPISPVEPIDNRFHEWPAFDLVAYRNRYPDLQAAFGADDTAYRLHWLDCGINEGRRSSPAFDVRYYLESYPDLVNAFGSGNFRAAVTHYLNFGLAEGRQSAPDFAVQAYVARYPDLQAAFGQNWKAAANHWIEYGMHEGRLGSLLGDPDESYITLLLEDQSAEGLV